MDLERVALIKQRFLTLASCMPMDEFLSGWFFGVPSDQVLRGNVEDFIAYGFYCRRLEDVSPEVWLTLEVIQDLLHCRSLPLHMKNKLLYREAVVYPEMQRLKHAIKLVKNFTCSCLFAPEREVERNKINAAL